MILLRQFEKLAEEKGFSSQLQFGFREGVSCLYPSFIIGEFINHLIERGGKAFAYFLDVRKHLILFGLMVCYINSKMSLALTPKCGWLSKCYSKAKSFSVVISATHLVHHKDLSKGEFLLHFCTRFTSMELDGTLMELDIGITLFNHSL